MENTTAATVDTASLEEVERITKSTYRLILILAALVVILSAATVMWAVFIAPSWV